MRVKDWKFKQGSSGNLSGWFVDFETPPVKLATKLYNILEEKTENICQLNSSMSSPALSGFECVVKGV